MFHGAQGELIQPKLTATWACEAMMEHKDPKEGARSFIVPPEVEQWVKCYSVAKDGDMYHIKPGTECIGAVVGIGDTAEEAIAHLKDNVSMLTSKKITVEIPALVEAVQELHDAQEQGVEIEGGIPEPASVLEE